ncbi:hypothetical protein ACE38W_08790 [Chitinophaga sp. Hz27]|uniref:hypothetical protein n=1 Tax=Chitinophaga sp. Hz27 TaxID=3347169 RepID=UPI0035DF65FD
MKKAIILFAAVILAGVSINRSNAQVSVNINIGSQPTWGPVGYDYAQYYYMPDIDAYYNIANRQFVYLERNRWVFAPSLPGYFNYDLDRGYKVVINEPNPWMRPDVYRARYAGYRGWYGKQVIIRNRYDNHYMAPSRIQDYRIERRDDRRVYSDRDNRGWGHDDNRWGRDNRDNHNDGNRFNDRRNDRNNRWHD